MTEKEPEPPRSSLALGERKDAVRGADLGGLDGLLGYHLRMAQIAFQRRFDRAVQGSGLSQVQFAVLWLINANPGASQIDLAGVIGVDRPGMMAIIDRLELRNLVVRRLSTADRRRRELFLTQEGKRAFAESLPGVEAMEEALHGRVSVAEAAMFKGVVERLSK